jgi:transcriptional regulator with XRE-family HTH domain
LVSVDKKLNVEHNINMDKTFGNLFREIRRKSGISQRRLADLCGVDFSYVSKIENDRLPAPAADTLVRFAKHLGCPAEDLLAAAQKLPGNVGTNVASYPSAVRFLQEASELELTSDEWEAMRGSLQSLRAGRPKRRRKL